MSNILITGGAGYIGSHVGKLLGRAGHRVVTLDSKGDASINWTEDFFMTEMSKKDQNKALLIFLGFPGALGLILVSICLFNPWIALIGYTIYIFTSLNPVKILNSLLPTLAKMIK